MFAIPSYLALTLDEIIGKLILRLQIRKSEKEWWTLRLHGMLYFIYQLLQMPVASLAYRFLVLIMLKKQKKLRCYENWFRCQTPQALANSETVKSVMQSRIGDLCLQSKSCTFLNGLVSEVRHIFYFEGEHTHFLFWIKFLFIFWMLQLLCGLRAWYCSLTNFGQSASDQSNNDNSSNHSATKT